MKVLTVIGTRPNFVKAYLLSHQLRNRKHKEILVHTGQHFDFEMSKIFFKDLNIPTPKYNLNLRGEAINQMLESIILIIKKEKPDLIMIYGDTNSSLAGAVAGHFCQIPVAHVEAGVRTYDLEMIEEKNRIIIDHFSSLLFCPTKNALNSLKKEGYDNKAYFSGDVMYDAVLDSKSKLQSQEILKRYQLETKKYYVLTLHRQNSVDNKQSLMEILSAIKSKMPIVFPIHPRTRKNLTKFGLLDKYQQTIKIIPPLGYLDMLSLVNDSKIVITDSGGLQKEAFFLNVPCVVLLDKPGWIEIVRTGWNQVTGINQNKIKKALSNFEMTPLKTNLEQYFGNGQAVNQIVSVCEKYISNNQ